MSYNKKQPLVLKLAYRRYARDKNAVNTSRRSKEVKVPITTKAAFVLAVKKNKMLSNLAGEDMRFIHTYYRYAHKLAFGVSHIVIDQKTLSFRPVSLK